MRKRIICLLIAAITIAQSVYLLKRDGTYAAYYGESVRSIPVYSVERTDKKLSISFDCAWGTEHTDAILKALDDFGVKCTFFAVEFWVKKYPDYAKKIVEKGHRLETHSATHSHMAKLSKEDIRAELTASSTAIEEATGVKPTLFRPPFGEYDDLLVDTAREEGFEVIQWDVDSLDWKDLSSKAIAERILQKAGSGSIILCHNNGLHTAEALPAVFAALQNKGYEFVTIDELIYKDNFSIDGFGRQRLNE